jgi:hypothetical protein
MNVVGENLMTLGNSVHIIGEDVIVVATDAVRIWPSP